jgi:hypothetical protein
MTYQHGRPGRPITLDARILPLSLLFFLLLGGTGSYAASPFELEIGELERGAGTQKVQKGKPHRPPKAKKGGVRAAPGRATAQDLEGEFVNYTIRPGDHIYKVLTSRFGLSSAKAEELIPRILRINGITDIRGLQVGRTIRIPLSGKITREPAQPPPPAPQPPAVEEKPAVATKPAEPAPPQETAAPMTALCTITAKEPAVIADALLDALALKWDKAHPVTIPLGGSAGATLTIPVDRYFEDKGKRYFLDLGAGDPNRATLERLLEISGYRRIAVGAKDDFRTIAGRILEALEIRTEYRKYLFAPRSGGPGAVEIQGYLVIRREGTAERLFLTDSPMEKPLKDLISAGQWEIK